MQLSYIELTYWQVGLAALLIVVNAAISVALRLGMERTLVVAAVRMTLQLLLVGLVLEWVFHVERWYVVLAMLAVMTLVAGVTAVDRNTRRYRGIWIDTIISVWASSWIVAAFGVFGVLRQLDTWYHPQYAIPLLGMILGNTLNGISVGLATYTESLVTRRAEVDTLLALGATRWEAGRAPMRHAPAHRPHADRQRHDGGRHRESARYDDRPVARRRHADPGRKVSDCDHVPDRGGHGTGHGRRGAAGLPPPVYGRSPVFAGEIAGVPAATRVTWRKATVELCCRPC